MLRRHQTWYARLRIPADLRPLLGSHLVRSLQTHDRMLANQRAIALLSGFHGIWMDIRKKLADEIVALQKGEREPGDLRAFVQEHSEDIRALPEDAKQAFERLMATTVQKMRSDNLDARHRIQQYEGIVTLVNDARQKGIIEGLNQAIQSQNTNAGNVPPAYASPASPAEEAFPETPWKNLIQAFQSDHPGHSEKTRKNYLTVFGELEDVIGNKPTRDITKADVKSFADYLRDKPSHTNPEQTLHHDTIVRNLGNVKTFLKWCVDSGHCPDRGFADIKARAKTTQEKRTRQEDIRRAFTETELRRFFHSPLFTGYKSASTRSRPGHLKTRNADFWFFVVMALTGARTEEVAMIPARLYDLDGIPCLDLQEAGTKTGNSPRLIPILPDLKKIGLLRYAETQHSKGQKLIPYPSATIENEASGWSKRTNHYLNEIGLTEKNLVTYSFRHTFRQVLRVSGINQEIVDKIFGHETGEVGARYGSNLAGSEARQFLEKTHYPIDLSHLFAGLN